MGTILTKVLFDVYNDKQYIFELKDINNNILSLYRNNERKLVVDFNGQATNTSFIINNNHQWNIIGLSFKQQIAADSTESTGLQVRVYLNGEVFETLFITTTTINSASLSLGAKHTKEEINTLLSSYETNYPLYGLIEYMIVKEDSYLFTSTMDDLSDKMNVTKKVNLYDKFGLLVKTEVLEGNSSVISNLYSYKTVNANQNLTTDLELEVIKSNNTLLTTRKYETDEFSRIIKITDAVFGDHEYSYNNRGFLVSDGETTYTYDDNGNILSKGDLTFTYTNGKLTKVGTISVLYDDNDILIKQYGNNQYEYENNKLTKVINNSKNREISFTYDLTGLRIRKTDVDTTNGNTFITNYKYSGNKLIREESDFHSLDFLYDEKGLLYGFIYNCQDKYFYIRDVTGLILGITLQNGTKVVECRYDSWGSLISVTDDSRDAIGSINPFIYKGYYYDVETSLFWLSSRYYSSELCIFISPDSIEYLDPESIN